MTSDPVDIRKHVNHETVGHGSILEAWAAVMADVRSVDKSQWNDQQRYKFRGIDAVVNAVGPALRKHQVIITPRLVSIEYHAVTVGKNNTAMGHARVVVQYTARHGKGELLIAEVPGEAMDVGDKAVAKAMSVAYRIALLQSLTLPTDDPDPDAESFERAPAKRPTRQPAATPAVPAVPADPSIPERFAPTGTVTMRRGAAKPPAAPEPADDGNTRQHRLLMALFSGAGIKDHNARIMYAEQVIDRQIASTNDLTSGERSKVIDALKTHTEKVPSP